MKKISTEKKYTDKHSGIKYSQLDINQNKAKAAKILFERQFDEEEYNFCQECGINGSSAKLDPAHIKSVAQCIADGDIELIWSVINHKILCRGCHKVEDGLNLQFKTQE